MKIIYIIYKYSILFLFHFLKAFLAFFSYLSKSFAQYRRWKFGWSVK